MKGLTDESLDVLAPAADPVTGLVYVHGEAAVAGLARALRCGALR